MKPMMVIGILLIAAGALGLLYGSFTYTKETHEMEIGSIGLAVEERETVNVPVWAGAGAIGVGVVLLLVGAGRR